jgi:hypothetical protein
MSRTPSLFDRPAPAVAAPERPALASIPCTRPFSGHYTCRIGGGDAAFSDDSNKTHFCRAHAPFGFFPHERGAR